MIALDAPDWDGRQRLAPLLRGCSGAEHQGIYQASLQNTADRHVLMVKKLGRVIIDRGFPCYLNESKFKVAKQLISEPYACSCSHIAVLQLKSH